MVLVWFSLFAFEAYSAVHWQHALSKTPVGSFSLVPLRDIVVVFFGRLGNHIFAPPLYPSFDWHPPLDFIYWHRLGTGGGTGHVPSYPNYPAKPDSVWLNGLCTFFTNDAVYPCLLLAIGIHLFCGA